MLINQSDLELLDRSYKECFSASDIMQQHVFSHSDAKIALQHLTAATAAMVALERRLAGCPIPKVGE